MPLSLLIHVPAGVARAFTVMAGRHPLRRFVTPRGKAWTTSNAQETLARLVEQLDLEHYTLHGLRKTGPSALTMLGFEDRAIRSLAANEVPAILQRGEMVLTERPQRQAAAPRGAAPVNITIESEDPGAFRRSQTQIAQEVARAQRRAMTRGM